MSLIDSDTGEVLELPGLAERERTIELEAQVERLKENLEIELEEKRKLRSQLSAARSERNKKREIDPYARDARRVFDYWQEQVAPKAREFGPDRFDAVVARLRAGATVEELFEAIDGCKAKPYVTDSGRSATGAPDQRQADLELICRSEKHVTRFRSYAAQEPALVAVGSGAKPIERKLPTKDEVFIPAREIVPTPFERVVWALEHEFGAGRLERSYNDERRRIDTVWAPCPLKRSEKGYPLAVIERDRGAGISIACAHGCDHEQLLAALAELERRHEGAQERAKAAVVLCELAMAKAIAAAKTDLEAAA